MAGCNLSKLSIREVVYTSVLLGMAMLDGCGKSNSDANLYGPNPFPNGGPQVKLSFTGRPLTGLSSSPVIAFPTPP